MSLWDRSSSSLVSRLARPQATKVARIWSEPFSTQSVVPVIAAEPLLCPVARYGMQAALSLFARLNLWQLTEGKWKLFPCGQIVTLFSLPVHISEGGPRLAMALTGQGAPVVAVGQLWLWIERRQSRSDTMF